MLPIQPGQYSLHQASMLRESAVWTANDSPSCRVRLLPLGLQLSLEAGGDPQCGSPGMSTASARLQLGAARRGSAAGYSLKPIEAVIILLSADPRSQV